MKEGASAAPPREAGKITAEDIERARRQIGVPKFSFNPPFNRFATTDTLSRFAWACGDDNPLWHSEEYGGRTRWDRQLGFPLFLHSTGINLTPKPSAEMKTLFKGLFRGVGKYYTGVNWVWWRPVLPGDQLYV
ncbi:MAG TPA: hypothetical protein VK715_08120, partial [Steroidobacteraceae bacterium]|nr:hypothetical protein [Steroidobacteraceae bacterium]